MRLARGGLRRGLSAARVGLACLHLGVAWSSFVRPHMTEIVLGYAAFDAIAPTMVWGVAALFIGLGLLLIPRAQPVLIVWQTASAMFFALFCILVTRGPAELTWGSMVYGGLSVWSMLLAYVTADDYFAASRLPQRVRTWLARTWARWRARGHA